MAYSKSVGRARRAVLGIVVGGACAAVLAPGCSSDSAKKKAPTMVPDGEGGDSDSSAGSNSHAGAGAHAGATGSAGKSGGGGEAGESLGGSSGEAGAGAQAGDAGAANLCPSGFGNCETSDPDCETPLTLSTSCGACGVSCDGSHGTVACTEAKCIVSACATNYGDCDDDGATGCETPIDTDTHCGACTRNCAAAGTTCTTGKCGAITLLATGGSGYQAAFVAGDSLYLMNTGSMPPGNYTTTRVPLNGSAATKITDNEGGGPGQGVLNADASFVYWAIQGNPPTVLKKAITAVPLDPNTVVFHPVAMPNYLTIIGGAYYWMTTSSPTATIYTRSTSAAVTDQGTQIVTTDQSYVSSFRATTDRLYWVHRNTGTATLSYVPLAGGTPVTVPDSVVGDSAQLYSVGNTLYFVRTVGSVPENGIYKYTPGDTTVTQLVQSNTIHNMVADANAVYYNTAYDGVIYKAPLTGKQGVPIASGFAGQFGGQDATFLYSYASWGSDGPVRKLLK